MKEQTLDALRRALDVGQIKAYEPLEQQVADKPSGNAFSRWVIRLLGRSEKSEPKIAYSQKSVSARLEQDYGTRISSKVLKSIGSKPLTSRRIVQLHGKAVRLKDQIDRTNSQHLNKWLNLERSDSLASKVFISQNGFSPKELPRFERMQLQEHMQEALYREGDHKLSPREARSEISHILTAHRSGLSVVASETAQLVGAELMLEPGEPFYPQHYQQWLGNASLNDYDRKFGREFMESSYRTANLQWSSPYDQLDSSDWGDQIADAGNHKGRLQTAVKALEAGAGSSFSPVIRETMALDLYRQIKNVNEHVHFLEHLSKADFRGPGEQRKLEEKKLNTALLILDNEIEHKGRRQADYPSTKLVGQIEGMKTLRAKLLSELDALPVKKFPSHYNMKKAIKENISHLQRDMKASGVSSHGLKKRWEKTAAAVSNSFPWETISKTLPVRLGGQMTIVKSEQIPAGQIKLHVPGQAHGNTDPFAVSYLRGGRSSADQSECTHAVNMYETRLENSEGKELFSSLRSGTLYPYKESDEIKREEGLENRGRELLTAAFTRKFSGLSEEQQNQILSGEVMAMDFVTTSLMSPDMIRHVSGINDDEYNFQEKQNMILQQLCAEQPLALEVKDSQGNTRFVKTQVRLASLNIPVNPLALNGAVSTIGQTWKSSDNYNDSGLEVLLGNTHPDGDIGGMVADWLKSADATPAEKDIVRQLTQQIRTLYSQQQHHHIGSDAYKLVERVQLLAHKVGAVSHFGCKSGKDRTGEADARTKVLATEIDRLGYVPDPMAPPTQEHREAVQTYLYGAGEVEIQDQNINLPGFKTTYGEAEQGKALYKILH